MEPAYPPIAVRPGPTNKDFVSAEGSVKPARAMSLNASDNSAAYAALFSRFFVLMRSFWVGRIHVEGSMKGAYITTRGMTSSATMIIKANGISLHMGAIQMTGATERSRAGLLEGVFLVRSNEPRFPPCQRRSTSVHALPHSFRAFTVGIDQLEASYVEFLV